jgi:acyl carrier protein
MVEMTDPQRELAALIIDVLNLEELQPDDIGLDVPLFGDGLGLDSIDALEIAVAVAKNYGVHLRAEDEQTQAIFMTLRTLSDHIVANAEAAQP